MGAAAQRPHVERLIGDALATLDLFGAPGDDVQELLDGPFADPAARREFQNAALRRTARRLAGRSPYYRELFAAAGVKPEDLTVDGVTAVPVTRKQALVERHHDFLAAGVRPYLTSRTTGTAGKPAEVWISRYEAEVGPGIRASDCMQLNISFEGQPLTAAFSANFGSRSADIGLGDLLVFSLITTAAYKAYGRRGVAVMLPLIVVFGALVPGMAPLVMQNFVRAGTGIVVPVQSSSARPPSSPTCTSAAVARSAPPERGSPSRRPAPGRSAPVAGSARPPSPRADQRVPRSPRRRQPGPSGRAAGGSRS